MGYTKSRYHMSSNKSSPHTLPMGYTKSRTVRPVVAETVICWAALFTGTIVLAR